MSRTSTRIALVGASALAIFAAWLTAGANGSIGLGFLYLVPIGCAAWWFGRRAAAVVVLACAGLYGLGAAIDPVPHLLASVVLRLFVFAAGAVLVILLRERAGTLDVVRADLSAIQAALAPAEVGDFPGVEAGAAFIPSEHGVSGDFYLLTNGPDGSAVAILGDVVGHGPPAARSATFLRARLAALAANSSDPVEIMSLANDALLERRPEVLEPVSALCLRLDPGTEAITWAVAGHPPPLHLPSLRVLEPQGKTLLLGVETGLRLQAAKRRLEPGDAVLAYTDGAIDVRRGREHLGEQGLIALLEEVKELPARELARALQDRVVAWADRPIADDICILALRPKPS